MCCGQPVPATVEAVQQLLTARGLTAEQQAREWLNVGRTLAEPAWMRTCADHAKEMAGLVVLEREVLTMLDGSAQEAHGDLPPWSGADVRAERHFSWLGERQGVTLGVVRDGIGALARSGYIAPDAEQQAALRRALGIAVNAAEAGSSGPWVRWLGEGDALNYLVEELWQMGLIDCPGGRRYKWQTLCGAFLRHDGRRFDPIIKNNRCTNPRKIASLEEAMLGGLRFVCGRAAPTRAPRRAGTEHKPMVLR